MNYNYHNHTYRCRHATGTPEEYVKRAIECGLEYFGFSDHFPFIFPDGYEPGYRVPVSEVKEYFGELNELREKYKNEIDIKIGFEMEYYPLYFDEMVKNAIEYGAEYLILGVHYIMNEHPDGPCSFGETDNSEYLAEYVKCVTEAIKSGVFTYVAHPDVFNYIGDENLYREEMKKICIASRKHNVPLELNFLGIRGNRIYPNEKFWEIAGEEQSPVTFGCDAHDSLNAFDGESYKKAMEIVEKFKLNYIGKPEIISVK